MTQVLHDLQVMTCATKH